MAEVKEGIKTIVVAVILSLMIVIFTISMGYLVHITISEDKESNINVIINEADSKEETKSPNLESFLLGIDQLKKNCNSTQITKEFNSKEWSVFFPLGEENYKKISECYE